MGKYNDTCIYVDNGDTFQTSKGHWVRLANVCAPVLGEPGFLKAKITLENLILGEEVVYEQVGTSYNRLVAEVWIGSTQVNSYMRDEGNVCP